MYCPKCNTPLSETDTICPSCKAFVSDKFNATNQLTSEGNFSPSPQITGVPNEIKKWNWGAFSLSIFWGVGNYTYLPLLSLIPFFNLIWIFICGAKGNEWAYKSGKFDSVEDFLATQETWNRAGLAFFIIQILLFFYTLFNWVAFLTPLLAQ